MTAARRRASFLLPVHSHPTSSAASSLLSSSWSSTMQKLTATGSTSASSGWRDEDEGEGEGTGGASTKTSTSPLRRRDRAIDARKSPALCWGVAERSISPVVVVVAGGTVPPGGGYDDEDDDGGRRRRRRSRKDNDEDRRAKSTTTATMARGPPELMSPAGGWPQLRVAVANGADAVYIGLTSYSARARGRAANFNSDPTLPWEDDDHDEDDRDDEIDPAATRYYRRRLEPARSGGGMRRDTSRRRTTMTTKTLNETRGGGGGGGRMAKTTAMHGRRQRQRQPGRPWRGPLNTGTIIASGCKSAKKYFFSKLIDFILVFYPHPISSPPIRWNRASPLILAVRASYPVSPPSRPRVFGLLLCVFVVWWPLKAAVYLCS
jgi:hypothetical protein